ncbi:T9SS type A sorting domain-containing protein [Flavobacterium franklandianum]|uniref:T9SS type A sorting domain-containing protein n=1 Tax=Flavobacterium franklandianum TaxID=2594430 RepID=UPI00117BA75A|nr:T9SS type A sorting domain-containing protein [Flavobacterium franklandianum]TRX25207.1 T9SS type A sorting domain-containing protein [Flavobacterium franklandianum]
MKKITILIALMITSLVFSQDLVLGFEAGESGGVNGGPFGNMPAPAVEAGTGTNTSQVLKIVGSGGPEVWQGINLNLTSPVQLTSTKSMTIDVLSSAPITFLVKVNGGLSGAPEAAAEVTHNGNGLWQTLTFTFNTALDGKAATANGIYSSFVIHAYWTAGNTTFAGVLTPARTFYVDNIKGVIGTPPVEPAPTAAAPTPPNRAPADVISLFSDAYTNIAVTEWSTGWDDSSIADVTVAGNATKKITFGNFLGVQLGAYTNATSMTHFHMDYYINVGTDLVGKVLNPKLSNHAAMAGETNALLLTNLPTVAGSWVSLDVPLSDFAPQGAGPAFSREAIYQFLISSNIGIVYVDNIYLHNNIVLGTQKFETSKVKMYPNPVKNTLTIEANSEIQRVSVYNILGQEVMKSSPKSNTTTLQTNELQKGVYMVTTEIEGKLNTSKVVKE